MNESISPAELAQLLDQDADIKVLDVRRREDQVDVEYPIPGAEWRDPEQIAAWAGDLEKHGEIIVYCVHGHSVGKNARDFLRKQGLSARFVEGGIEAWQAFSRRS
jgi:Fe-Mn family superoxide dismutase